ncbi:hypothetical protein BDA99DRAFT_540823 [Phascolomyces articulosus]|uniref:Uncharacterized protein n=1 Tax=Phascolomyces articulosus TaxID=60185 RepID=A0AAD5PAC1_9FUNG|nr:hypothetical protein BDA99DRAFT_540823 [Phascolomyces articulosus]
MLLSRLQAISQLFLLACEQSYYHVSRVITGIAYLLSKLPNNLIVNTTTISETELLEHSSWSAIVRIYCCFGSIELLLKIVTNRGTAVQMQQYLCLVMNNIANHFGHGEIKVAELTHNSDALCCDILTKAIDNVVFGQKHLMAKSSRQETAVLCH